LKGICISGEEALYKTSPNSQLEIYSSYGRRCPIRHLQSFRPFIAAICCLALFPLFAADRHRSVSPAPLPTQLTANPDAYAAGQGKALTVAAGKGVLVNDRDPQGKALIALLVTNTNHGSLTFNADGSFTYTNDGTGAASDSFTYQASNGTALSNVATVTMTIGGPDAITAAADSYSLPHGGSITVAAPGVLANDIDPTGATLTASAAALPAHGSLTLNANGSFIYAHDGTNTTSDSFSYRATDGTLQPATGSATLTIGADTAPAVASQTYATLQNTQLTVAAPGVLTSAVDPDSPTITALLQTPATHGAVTLNANGSFVYTPATGFTGNDSFTYRGSDGIVTSANVGTAAITVSAIPRPSAADDRYVATTPTLAIAAPGILGNDTINGASIISFGINGNDQSGIGHPAVTSRNGQIALNADGSFAYNAPSATFAGDDTFRYVISNAAGTSAASVTITVAPINTKCPSAAIVPSTLPVGAAGAIYPAVSFTMIGAAAPVVWASGTLPAGMSFSNAGVLTGTPASVGSYNIALLATDANACVVTATLTLTVGCPPISISATNLAAATAGIAYPTVVLSASGGTAPFAWTVSSGSMPAGMNLSASGVLSGTPPQTGFFTFTVKATDANSCSATRDLALAVNSKCPAITITTTSLPAGAAGAVYPAVSFSQTGGAAPVTWSAGTLPPGMSLSNAGVLFGTPASIGVFNVTVTATDANGCTATASLPLGINITCPTIAISAINLPAATGGAAYPSVTLSETGGIAPFTWSVSSGTLPAGITLSSSGVLSGTPAQIASFLFVVKATDANGCFGTQTLSIIVNAKCPAITINPATLPGGTPGTVYPAISFSQTGGAQPVTWTAAALPPGMAFSGAGVLSGTPSSIGVFNITVTATDANGCSATVTRPLSVSVICPVMAITAPTLAEGTVGAAYPAVTLAENSGLTPITWSVVFGTLPSGMTLTTSGVLAGTPAQSGSFTFTVKAMAANGCFGTSDLSIVVKPRCAAITIMPTTLPDATLGIVYPAISFSQSGGTEPVTWSSGVVPPGMNISADGVLSGTPTAFGVFNIAVTARDANNCTSSVLARITIANGCSGMAIITPPLASGTADTPYVRTTFQTSGSAGTVTWRVALGELPVGMTFSPAGVLDGTPTQPGTFAATIEATDARGCRATAAIQLTIDPKCTGIIISGTPPHGKLGDLYPAFTFSQTGGTPIVTWSSGALPAGMRFSTTGVLSGTPLGTGTFSLVLQVTDAIGCIGTATIKFVVGCPAIIITPLQTISSSALPEMTQGVPYAPITFSHTGGVGPFVWGIAHGTLPDGVTFSSTGILSGTPTSTSSSSITFQVTDAAGCVGKAAFSVGVACATNSVNNPPVTAAVVNSNFNQTFTISSTTTGTFSTTSALPAGLGLSSNGVLSGTPTETGTFPIVVTFTDGSCSYTNNQGYSLAVNCNSVSVSANAALQRSIASGYIVFSAFEVVTGRGLGFSASGSNGSTTFTASGLPSGLTLQPNGLLAGQVLGSGGSLTVHVIDENGCSGSTVYPVLVVF
jgi:VCBS repeat-containing protein